MAPFAPNESLEVQKYLPSFPFWCSGSIFFFSFPLLSLAIEVNIRSFEGNSMADFFKNLTDEVQIKTNCTEIYRAGIYSMKYANIEQWQRWQYESHCKSIHQYQLIIAPK